MRVSHKFKNLTTLVWDVGGLTEEKINDQNLKKNFRYDIIFPTKKHILPKNKKTSLVTFTLRVLEK